MNISKKTILITGGGSGIGLAFAKALSEKDNQVIIVSRNLEKLQKAAQGLKNVIPYQADITDKNDVILLSQWIKNKYPELSIVINNAGIGNAYLHGQDVDAFEKASQEFLTNYLSIVRLNEYLLPVLKLQAEAAVVHVSSIVAISPNLNLPTYSDSKAALHSYSVGLRLLLSKDSAVKVFEIMPPLVDTDLTSSIGGKENGIAPFVVAEDLVSGLANDLYEIHVGQTKDLHALFFQNPQMALEVLNKI